MISLNPETFVEGGGLIDDAKVTFDECSFEMFDYGGKIVPGVPTLKVSMTTEDGDEVTQNYSVGSPKDWAPSEDGKGLVAVGKATALRLSSNCGIFLQNLVDVGFPADKLGEDISILKGLVAHVIQIPAPKRAGLKKKEGDFEKTILVVDEIIKLPWEKKSKKTTKAKAKAKTSTKTEEAEGDSDLNAKAIEHITKLLAEGDGTLAKKDLPAKLFTTLKTDPDRNAIIKIAFDDEFLEAGPWTYNSGEGTLTL
ncbi:MAG: hypothetical protein B1H40_00110 [Candidatus Latescibacteria bacterium 4484_181]|nr:MAG: hypothetical protein B1H40_00110 [Candidatus Latescibacteria bacterium 4484_181]